MFRTPVRRVQVDPGGATGVAEFDEAEAADVPLACVAVTVKVYAVPDVKPLTVIGEFAPEAVTEPGELVTV